MLDPATQVVALILVLGMLAFFALDLAGDSRSASAGTPFRARQTGSSPRAEAPRKRAAEGPAIEFVDGDRGRVRAGPCRGMRLEDLTREQCEAQLAFLRYGDAGAAAKLESFMRRRFAAPAREEGNAKRAQALRELGLAEGASAAQIHAAYVRLIKKHHPDHGGSHAKAARINEAKDVLAG